MNPALVPASFDVTPLTSNSKLTSGLVQCVKSWNDKVNHSHSLSERNSMDRPRTLRPLPATLCAWPRSIVWRKNHHSVQTLGRKIKHCLTRRRTDRVNSSPDRAVCLLISPSAVRQTVKAVHNPANHPLVPPVDERENRFRHRCGADVGSITLRVDMLVDRGAADGGQVYGIEVSGSRQSCREYRHRI
jgi:hypothetical protein